MPPRRASSTARRWIPSQGRYREVTSCSNTTDYQARRLGARFRPEAEATPLHPHTLNGTAVAVGRTLIALLENGQRADGSVALPSALRDAGAPPLIGGQAWPSPGYSPPSLSPPSSGSRVSAQELRQ